MGHPANTAFERFQYLFIAQAEADFKLLLETKHLYQKVSIGIDGVVTGVQSERVLPGVEKEEFERLAKSFVNEKFSPSSGMLLDQYRRPALCLVIGNVKLFCSKCNAREAFRPIWFSDITNELLKPNTDKERFRIAFKNAFQLLYLVYQCQRCQGVPEVFLIKRDELSLSVEGRSPIEHVEVPAFIPKDEKKWFRDAIIAFQSGKVLAALFYMRTFIEQFARRKTNLQNDRKTGDEIMAAYSQTLPDNLRDSMPSLGEWYDKLSEALHGAKDDSGLFESAKERVEKHFDIRRVHDLD
jgi:hypothetical protein